MRIPFTKFNLSLRKTDSSIVEIEKRVLDEFIGTDSRFKGSRPQLNPNESMGDDQILMPYVPIPMDIIYDTARYSDVLRTIHQNLRKEIFRKGYEIEEVFAVKCEDCDKEFDQPVDECDECGSTNLREPDLKQKRVLQTFCKDVNDNGQDLVLVSENLNDDLETIDNAFLLMIKDYYWDNQGQKIGEVPVELIRCDPRFMYIMADKMGRPAMNQNGDHLSVCFEHRETLLTNQEKCEVCGKETFPANYRSQNPGGQYQYYNKNEVCHRAKYNPSLTYGFSVIYAVWMKVVTLMNMDQYMKNYYAKQRPPRGLLFVNTPNMDSLTKAWNWMLDEFRKNPHQIPPIAIEQTAGSKGNLVNFIDMMKTMDEMQYIECRNEMRRQIGAVYGVMPLFQGDISTSGGLNNEGLQITVTNRAIVDGQGVYNDGFYPWICKQMQITDYKIWLPPNEEEDLIHKEELFSKKIDNASKMQQMGFDVILNEEGDFEFDPLDEPVEKPDPMGGMMGGMPGEEEATDPDQEEPNQEPVPDGTPAAPEVASMQELGGEPPVADMTKELKKGKVYLAAGQEAPEGATVQQGKQGGRYYESESSKKVSMRTIKDKEIDDMTPEELEYISEQMENSKTSYDSSDLESAKNWLSGKPHLRSKLGNKYYEFAVQVATAINEGYDPEEIDWASLDSEIPLADSLTSMREGSIEASTKKGKKISGSLKKGKVYLKPGESAPQGVNVQQGPKGGKFYEGTPTSQEAQVNAPKEPGERKEKLKQELNEFSSYYEKLPDKYTFGLCIDSAFKLSKILDKHNEKYEILRGQVDYFKDSMEHVVIKYKGKIYDPTKNQFGDTKIDYTKFKEISKEDLIKRFNGEPIGNNVEPEEKPSQDPSPSKEKTPKKTLYHGTSAPEFSDFKSSYVYLTDQKPEAKEFSTNPISGGGRGKGSPRVLDIEVKPGKTRDISVEIDEGIMDTIDPDEVIADMMPKLKEEGVRYVTFMHPGAATDDEFEATVSLYPKEDLKIKKTPTDKAQAPSQETPKKTSPSNPVSDMKQEFKSIAQKSIDENPEYDEEGGFSTGECANISDSLKQKLKSDFNIDSETVEVTPPRPGQVGSDHSAVYIPSKEMVVDTQLWQFEKDQRNGSKPKPLNERKWVIPKKEYEEMGYKIQK